MSRQRKRGQGLVRFHRGGWEATIQIDGVRHYERFASESDAWKWLATIKADAIRGVLKAPSEPAPLPPITFGNLARLLADSKQRSWRPGHDRFFRGHCKTALFPTFEHRYAHEIKAEELQAFLDAQIGRPVVTSSGKQTGRIVKASTVAKYDQLLRQIFRFGVRKGRISKSPMDAVERPGKQGREERDLRELPEPDRVLRPHELRALLDVLEADERAVRARLDLAVGADRPVLQRAYEAACRRRAFFTVLAFTGLRKSEAFRMRWNWIDFDGRMLRVRVAKRGASEVPLCSTVIEILKALGPGLPDDLVFPGSTREAGRATPRDRNKMLTDMRVPLARALDAAKVDKRGVSLHTFRRTFLTLIEEIPGVTFSVVVALARHGKGSTGVTARYLKPSLDTLHGALSDLECRVFGTSNVVSLFGRTA